MATGKSKSKGLDIEGHSHDMHLSDLLEGLAFSTLNAVDPNQVEITLVTADSRQAKKKSLFVALSGTKTDGHLYLNDAMTGGCAGIVVEEGSVDTTAIADFPDVCCIAVADSRQAYSVIAGNFYRHPAREMTFVGITGTNGKTTVTYLLEHVLESAGFRVGVIGTVNYRYSTPSGKIELPAPYTTPEPVILQGLLRKMADAGIRYVLMEASSHALFLDRLGDVRFDVAAFTNLSHDHLDYHSGMEDYFAAKTRLFTNYLKKDGTAVVTCGEAGPEQNWQVLLIRMCRNMGVKTLTAGINEDAVVRLVHADSRRDGTTIILETTTGDIRINSPMVGRFNVENIVTTIGICQGLVMDLNKAAESLASAQGAPGRLQRVDAGDDPSRPVVFVDYAHTPDALRKVLSTLAVLPHKNLVCVFGCGGDRDAGKRPLMGAIAAKGSDVVIVTDDNPRSESSSDIIDQILPGIQSSGLRERERSWLQSRENNEKGFLVIPVREEAIATAVKTAGAEDIVLIAGKGHEKYQIGPAGKRFFDDFLEAREALVSWNNTSIGKAIGGLFAGSLSGPSFRSVCTDSRSIAANDIFVALKGDTFDGHDFLSDVVAAGAGCLVVSKKADFEKFTDIARFLVEDTQKALGDLAAYRRRLLRSVNKPLVIGLTGSCGKTTVKDMTAAIFERHWPKSSDTPEETILKTKGNFNNLIGLPLSLLPLGVKHKAAILEMGMNSPGEIARLARIAQPDISCIVSIHPAHLEGLHTLAGVAAAKEELFTETGEEGILVINLDDDYIRAMAPRYRQRKITFSATPNGRKSSPDLWASDIEASRSGTVSYSLHSGREKIRVQLNAAGMHNVGNSLAAAAMAVAAGCPLATIALGLGDFIPGDKRMVITESPAGYMLIDDTYNANPGSMTAGLNTLSQLAPGTTMAILGDMLELGEASVSSHYDIGRTAAEQGLSYLAVFGQFANDTKNGALSAGMDPEKVKVFEIKDEIASWVNELGNRGSLKKGDWILIKASRGMRFETIVAQLMVCS